MSDAPDRDFRPYIFKKWHDSTLSSDDAIEFLIREIPKFLVDTAEEDWVSFQICIATKGGKVTPLDICDFKIQKRTVDVSVDQTVLGDEAAFSLVALILSLYRLSNYKSVTKIVGKLRNILSVSPWEGRDLLKSLEAMIGAADGWCRVPAFRALVACVDMFIKRFPRHPYAGIRVGTLTTAHEGSSAVHLLDYFPNILGTRERKKAFTYIFDRKAAKELKTMLKPGQELGDQTSYTVYMRGLGIVQRSPYCVSLNPNLHTLIHFICGLFGEKRSLNSKLLKVKGKAANYKLLNLAVCTAYALAENPEEAFVGDKDRLHFVSGLAGEDSPLYPDDDDSEGGALPDLNTGAVFNFVYRLGGNPNSKMRTYFYNFLVSVKMRPNTVGEFIKEQLRDSTQTSRD